MDASDESGKDSIKEPHPTLFVCDGRILYYENSMMELYTAISKEEWEAIVHETVSYFTFLECLKKTACPILNEQWDTEDEWYRLQLELAVSRMRNLDPLLVASVDHRKIKREYTKAMRSNARQFMKDLQELKARSPKPPTSTNDKTISVSEL
jgi:hypothetical protein